MKSVVLPDYNANLIRALIGMKIKEKPIPVPSKDEVLIEMLAAPCNPSDIAFLMGGYNIKKPTPCIPGFEGVLLRVSHRSHEFGERLLPFRGLTLRESHDHRDLVGVVAIDAADGDVGSLGEQVRVEGIDAHFVEQLGRVVQDVVDGLFGALLHRAHPRL